MNKVEQILRGKGEATDVLVITDLDMLPLPVYTLYITLIIDQLRLTPIMPEGEPLVREGHKWVVGKLGFPVGVKANRLFVSPINKRIKVEGNVTVVNMVDLATLMSEWKTESKDTATYTKSPEDAVSELMSGFKNA